MRTTVSRAYIISIVGFWLILFFFVSHTALATHNDGAIHLDRIDVVPTLWSPGDKLVPCGNTDYILNNKDGTSERLIGTPCRFGHLTILVANLVSFAFYLSIPLAALSFAVAGILYTISQGNPARVALAHKIFRKVTIGIILIATAWFVVWLVYDTLVTQSGFSLIDQ